MAFPVHNSSARNSSANKTAAKLAALATAGLLTFSLAACSGDNASANNAGSSAAQSSASAEQSWPRSVTVGTQVVELKEAPQRVLIASSDVAALAKDIIPAERIAAMPKMGEPTPGGVKELPGDFNADPEQLLSMAPDLIVMTSRHQGEQDSMEMLKNAGVPIAVFDGAQWASPVDLAANARKLGELTGETDAAEKVATEIEANVAEAAKEFADAKDSPKVLALMARGPMRMAMGRDQMLNELVRQAHGTPIADSANLMATAPIDPERIKQLNPDVIIVEDFQGRGKQDFGEILSSSALADVPALRDGKVFYISDKDTGAAAGKNIGKGLTEVGHAIHGE